MVLYKLDFWCVFDIFIIDLVKLFPLVYLSNLSLAGCCSLTDKGIYNITLLPRLQKLNLSYVGVTDHSAENIHKNCKHLQKLVITYCPISTPFLLLLKQTIPNVVKRWWTLNVLLCDQSFNNQNGVRYLISFESKHVLIHIYRYFESFSHWELSNKQNKLWWESVRSFFSGLNYNECHVDFNYCMDFFECDRSYSWRSSMVLRKGIGRFNQQFLGYKRK